MSLPSLPTSASDVQASLSTASPAALQSSGDSLMASVTNAAQSTAQSASSNPAAAFAIVAAAAQAVVSGLPPGPATSVMAGAVAGATVGATLGAMIGSYIPIIGSLAGGLLGAEVGAEIGAVAAVIPELEADHWNFLKLIGQIAGSGIGAGAAAGAAAGSFVPVIGTGIGALAGAVIGDLAGATDPPIPDIRYLSEKVCFPAIGPITNNGDANTQSVFGLIPGQMNSTFRALPQSTFWQTQGGHNSAWSNLWSMLVSWRSPSGSTSTSRRAAWVLAQFYCRKFSARLGHDTSTSMSWESVVSVFGTAKRASQALLKLTQWYGDPATFSTAIPFASLIASGQYKPGTGWMPSGIPNNPQGVAAARREFERCPLDYLFYPIGVQHSGRQWFPASTANQTDVLLTVDGLLCTLAECAYFGFHDVTVFHLLVQLSYWWVHCRKLDQRAFPGLSTANHPNLSRCLALAAAQVRRTGIGLSPRPTARVAVAGDLWDPTAPAPTGATVRIGPGAAETTPAQGGSSADPSAPVGNVTSPTGSSGASAVGAAGGGAGGEFPWLLAGAGVAAGAAAAVAMSRARNPNRRSP